MGLRTTRPKNPITTDGIPARISINGLRKLRSVALPISAIYMAPKTPKGIMSKVAKPVTRREPDMRGIRPNISSLNDTGIQRVFNRLPKPGSEIKGKASLPRNTNISNTIRILVEAAPTSIVLIALSCQVFTSSSSQLVRNQLRERFSDQHLKAQSLQIPWLYQ